MPTITRKATTDTGADLAYVNPDVLTWALARSPSSRKQIASKLKIDESRLARWEGGAPIPFDKATGLASALRFPFGYFFLKHLPDDDLPIPDRRQLGPAYKPTPDFLQLVNDVLLRRDWYEDFLRTTGRPTKRSFVSSFDLEARTGDVAASIRKTLGVTPELRNTTGGWSEYLSALARSAEDAGILVMRSSVVGNSTNRPITTEEVQGFAITDPLVPVVFVNSRDFKAAQVFTFAHELAHIWIGQSAITNAIADGSAPSNDAVERFCDRVATEVLVPANEFKAVWDATRSDSRTATMPRRFWVSSFVVLRRAHELGRISTAEFHDLWASERKRIQRAKSPGGGDFYRTLFVRMGNKLTHSVVREVASNNLLIRDAARLLNVSPKTLSNVVEVAGSCDLLDRRWRAPSSL